MNRIEKFFKIKENGSSISIELGAGLTTFMTMAYILVVNPSILSTTGMDVESVFVATALSSAIATLVMALSSNLPIALAPGMGLNTFFAFTVVGAMGYSWQFALTAVLLEGILFIILTLTNLRESILNCIPIELKHAISGGIGLFITFIGLQSSGIIVANDATMIAMGDLSATGPTITILGILIIGILLALKMQGPLLFGIFVVTLIGIPLGVTQIQNFDPSKLFTIPSLSPTFWQFEFDKILSIDMLIVLSTMLFLDIFDTLGTIVGVTTKGNLLDENGNFPKAKQAFLSDAIGTTIGAVLGTSTVTSFAESAAGLAAGGRTGLTALTVSFFFFISIFLAPIFLIIPSQASSAALIIVGLFMFGPITSIDFDDYSVGIPAFFTIIGMAVTYSIAHGFGFGIICYVVINVCIGQIRKIHPFTYVVAAIFLYKFATG